MTRSKSKSKTKKPPAQARDPVTVVNLTASVCPFCRSTSREPYNGTQILRGPVSIGKITYARVELRRTVCSDCGRRRIDRGLVALPKETPEPGE